MPNMLTGTRIERTKALLLGLTSLILVNAAARFGDQIVGSAQSAQAQTRDSVSTVEASTDPLWKTAQALHQRAIVIDSHNDITSAILDEGFDLSREDEKVHTTLSRMKKGGLTAEFFSIYVSRTFAENPSRFSGGSTRRALDMIDATLQQVERHPAQLTLALTAADIERAKRQKKVAVLMGIEGGHALENSLGTLRAFYRLGVRYMTLTHSNTNDWADSSGTGEPEPTRHGGLSQFGEKVVREMQRIGMLVDVSHVSDEALADVLRIATVPVIASHSSSRALAPHPRNLTDDQLREIARNGGVVMVNFFPAYIDAAVIRAQQERTARLKDQLEALQLTYAADPAVLRKKRQELLQQYPLPTTPISVLIQHIEHIARIAGVDHVGLGSDFDGVPSLPEGIRGVEDLPQITYALLKLGWKEEDVLKVLGQNFLRVMRQAERSAVSAQGQISGAGDTTKFDALPLP